MASWMAAYQRVEGLEQEVAHRDEERTRSKDTDENFRSSHVIN